MQIREIRGEYNNIKNAKLAKKIQLISIICYAEGSYYTWREKFDLQ